MKTITFQKERRNLHFTRFADEFVTGDPPLHQLGLHSRGRIFTVCQTIFTEFYTQKTEPQKRSGRLLPRNRNLDILRDFETKIPKGSKGGAGFRK